MYSFLRISNKKILIVRGWKWNCCIHDYIFPVPTRNTPSYAHWSPSYPPWSLPMRSSKRCCWCMPHISWTLTHGRPMSSAVRNWSGNIGHHRSRFRYIICWVLVTVPPAIRLGVLYIQPSHGQVASELLTKYWCQPILGALLKKLVLDKSVNSIDSTLRTLCTDLPLLNHSTGKKASFSRNSRGDTPVCIALQKTGPQFSLRCAVLPQFLSFNGSTESKPLKHPRVEV